MTTEEVMLEWIATSSYEELLRKWRHEQPGSPWFTGPVGKAYDARMKKCRQILTIEEAVKISKRVGWIRSTNNRDFKDN